MAKCFKHIYRPFGAFFVVRWRSVLAYTDNQSFEPGYPLFP